ncbi:MAG TPA: hypothetical protein VIU44_15910 [Gaiellaceae bacterium]
MWRRAARAKTLGVATFNSRGNQMADQQDQGAAQTPQQQPGWFTDTQRTLALVLIVTLAAIVFATVVKVVWIAPPEDVLDLAKTLSSALVNMGLVALGYFFGSNVNQLAATRGQQNIIERLTPPPTPTPAPAAAPSPWWSRLTDAEKNVITAAAQNTGGAPDARVAAFVTASQVGAATADDVAYLVSKGLLTAERAAAIQSA